MGNSSEKNSRINKKFIKAALITSVIVFVLTAVFFIYVFIPLEQTKPFDKNDYIYDLEYAKELNGISEILQEKPFTCHVVVLIIVKRYLGFEANESEMRADLDILSRSTGMLPKENLFYARNVFEPLGYCVSLKNSKSKTEILNTISASIENNMPLVFFYSTTDDFNLPHYNTHYSVIYGIDMKSETIKISNPYGRKEVLSFQEMYDGMDFTSYKSMPFSFRVATKFGIVNKNSIITFEK